MVIEAFLSRNGHHADDRHFAVDGQLPDTPYNEYNTVKLTLTWLKRNIAAVSITVR